MIENLTKKVVLANKEKKCNTILSRGTGLMFKRQLIDEGYVFEFNKDILGSIHMLFVFFPIDIIWLNKKFEVIEAKENIRPFTPSVIPKKKSRYFIEFPSGTLRQTNTRIGDRIRIK